MKAKLLIPLIAGCGLCLVQLSATAQTYKEHISKQFTPKTTIEKTMVGIYNVYGSVKVEGYAGSQVSIEVDETISGETTMDVEQGKKEFKLTFEQNADTVMAFITAPYYTRPHTGNWNNEHDHDTNYKVQLDYVIKVPYNVNLHLSTINNGNIDVKEVYGTLQVNNINGGINIVNAKGATSAHTINGPITINYLSAPSEGSYHTINGQVNITYPVSLSADLQFKSMNGGFYTDFPNTELIPAKVEQTTDKKSGGTVYKLNKNTQLRVGSGGKVFKFETLNGNIYIKKQS